MSNQHLPTILCHNDTFSIVDENLMENHIQNTLVNKIYRHVIVSLLTHCHFHDHPNF